MIWTTTVTKTSTYDGDGRGIKQAVTMQVNSNAPSTDATFYLRSSVLGGRAISEYDAAGVRRNTYVWAGGEIIARQTREWAVSNGLVWRHSNPVTGDQFETDSQGRILAKTTLDPAGVDLGERDPFAGPSQGGDGERGMGQGSIDRAAAQLFPESGASLTIMTTRGRSQDMHKII